MREDCGGDKTVYYRCLTLILKGPRKGAQPVHFLLKANLHSTGMGHPSWPMPYLCITHAGLSTGYVTNTPPTFTSSHSHKFWMTPLYDIFYFFIFFLQLQSSSLQSLWSNKWAVVLNFKIPLWNCNSTTIIQQHLSLRTKAARGMHRASPLGGVMLVPRAWQTT